MTTEEQTEAIRYASLSYSKQSLNDVIFIWFIDKNLFTLAALKNSHVHTRNNKDDRRWSKMLSSHENDVQSVADGVCRCAQIRHYSGSILVVPKYKINEVCNCDLLMSQQLLPALSQVSGEIRKQCPMLGLGLGTQGLGLDIET